MWKYCLHTRLFRANTAKAHREHTQSTYIYIGHFWFVSVQTIIFRLWTECGFVNSPSFQLSTDALQLSLQFSFQLYILSYSNREIKNFVADAVQRTKRAFAMCICVLHAQCSCSTGLEFIYNILVHMWTYKHTKTDHTMVDFTIRYCRAHRERKQPLHHIHFVSQNPKNFMNELFVSSQTFLLNSF